METSGPNKTEQKPHHVFRILSKKLLIKFRWPKYYLGILLYILNARFKLCIATNMKHNRFVTIIMKLLKKSIIIVKAT